MRVVKKKKSSKKLDTTEPPAPVLTTSEEIAQLQSSLAVLTSSLAAKTQESKVLSRSEEEAKVKLSELELEFCEFVYAYFCYFASLGLSATRLRLRVTRFVCIKSSKRIDLRKSSL